ncbi:MAG: phosphate acyltransferase PlsX [Hyphomicrobiales bacterium]|nr:phosphate acyltransferase PlsX [Hyphomicrobiales bacterium]
MSENLILSIDAMGGDNAPEMVVEGLTIALDRHPDARFLLYGDEARLKPFLDAHARLRKVCEIRHADDVITNDAKPAQALRNGRQSSMRLAINAVKDGEATGIVSAGNTGALMAMAKFVLKTLPGIDRPAIATSFPTMRAKTVMLDLGANVECDAENLVQFAVMGEVFARNVLGLEQPSVGILNVGQEDLKGNTAVKQAAAMLQEADLPIKFYGFVEGDDLAAGTVDVIVTDGFTGNISLKSIEGTAKMFAHFLRESLMGSVRGKLGATIAKKALLEFKDRLDPRRYNGAMFLGLNGICVKSHGGTDGLGFSNAIRVAIELINDGVNDGIKDDFAHISEAILLVRERAEEEARAAEREAQVAAEAARNEGKDRAVSL